jgi:zinc transport system substrate-binding protein
MIFRLVCLAITLLILSVVSLEIPWAERTTDKITAYVCILPQAYFVKRIGGDHVDVSVLVGPGRSPATYEPTPKQITGLAKAKVFFRIGVPFENAIMQKIASAFKELKVVDTRQGIRRRKMKEPHGHGHAQDVEHSDESHKHEHGSGEYDPHIWLDPLLVKVQAQTISRALCKLDPANANDYRRNLDEFLSDLDRTHGEISKTLAPVKGKEIFVFHPAYGYFTDRYGLTQIAVEMGGKEPSARQLATLIDSARDKGVKAIFVQPQFNRRNAQIIAGAVGAQVISLDPIARDYLNNLKEMAIKIRTALKGRKK